jgi:hypothetical protein
VGRGSSAIAAAYASMAERPSRGSGLEGGRLRQGSDFFKQLNFG